MADLPDWFTQVQSATLRATSIQGGLDADKSASPVAEDVYLARDTGILYVCFVSGTWTNVGVLYLLLAGGTMSGAIAMGSNKITGLAAPTASTDGATKGYIDGLLDDIAQAQPSRALGTVYTNGAKIRVITVGAYATSTNARVRIRAYCDNVDGATTEVADTAGIIDAGANPAILCITIVVPPGYKYQVQNVSNATLSHWTEWDLH